MAQYVRLIAGLAFLSLALSGCHGASSLIAPANTQAMQSPNAMGTASFSIAVPAAGATTPQSLVVTLLQVNGAPPSSKPAPYTTNLTLGTKACVSQAGGGLSCTATVSAPPGNDMFALTTYSGVNGTGVQLATSQTRVMVSAGGNTPCPAPTTASKSM